LQVGELQAGVFEFLTTVDVLPLRVVSKSCKESVANHRWEDQGTRILDPRRWKECFPNAVAANVEYNTSVVDEDFEHFHRLTYLNMSGCMNVTSAAFVHLEKIHTLIMDDCNQITDEAFTHLSELRCLSMAYAESITDEAFPHLRGLITLNMQHCNGLTDAAIVHLKGIEALDISHCEKITDDALKHVAGLQALFMNHCAGLTDACLQHLEGIECLVMSHTLTADKCSSKGAAFEHLRGIARLVARGCTGISNEAVKHLAGVKLLDISQSPVSDAAFKHLRGVETLCIGNCSAVTEAAFEHIKGVKDLFLDNCSQTSITGRIFPTLLEHGLEFLSVVGCSGKVVASALQIGLEDDPILDLALYAISVAESLPNLSSFCGSFVNAGGIPVIIKMVRCEPSALLKTCALRVLFHGCTKPSHYREVIAANGMFVFYPCKLEIQPEDVVEAASNFLKNLVVSLGSLPEMGNNNPIRFLLLHLGSYTDSKESTEANICALVAVATALQYASGFVVAAEEITVQRGIPLITHALQAHLDVKDVVLPLSMALENTLQLTTSPRLLDSTSLLSQAGRFGSPLRCCRE
jgi:hypothetical protein